VHQTKFPPFSELIGQRTLLLGEPSTGKTTYSFQFLCFLLIRENVIPSEISVIDFAPPRISIGHYSIGGTFREIFLNLSGETRIPTTLLKGVRWLDQKYMEITKANVPNQFAMPRHDASSAEDVLKACCDNYKIAAKQLLNFLDYPTDYLIINDLGIFLHVGGFALLKRALFCTRTALLNAYFGRTLMQDCGSNISSREKRLLQLLSKTLSTFVLSKQFPCGDSHSELLELDFFN
jgi:hypothetical protein